MFARDGILYAEKNGEVLVIGLENRSYSGRVYIPERIRGKYVVGITPSAFEFSYIKDISLPYTLRAIGKGAFSRCNMLENVILTGRKAFVKNNTLRIEEKAFSRCSSLKSFQTSKSLILETDCFENCLRLTDVDSILVAYKNSFKNCVSLKYLLFEDDCELTDFNLDNTNIERCDFRGNATVSNDFLDSVVQKQCIIECFSDSNLCELAYCGFNISVNELPF